MPSLVTTAVPFSGGVDSVAGSGYVKRLTITNSWVEDEKVTLILTNNTSGVSVTIGAGAVTDLAPVFGMTLDQKSYFVTGSKFFFSDLDSPVIFNEPTAPGSGNVDVANYYGTPEDLTALAQYQNGMAVFSPSFVQIWEVGADPASYARKQTLQNIGTRNGKTVQSLGYLDVMFLDDSGVRSIRARESQLDAETIDSGSPIDSIIQQAIEGGAQVSECCSIVEPKTKSYWLFVPNMIYVLSRYRASKVEAWSTFTPSYETGLIPVGATYDANGDYNVADSLDGYKYLWDSGGNLSIVLTSGSASVTGVATGIITSQGSLVISGGTPLGLVEASVIGQKFILIEKFCIKDSNVFFRGADGYVYKYDTYDRVQVIAELPWTADKAPTTNKLSQGFDSSFLGHWTFEFGMDPETGTLIEVWSWADSVDQNVASTYDKKTISTQDMQGTHFKVRGESSAEYAGKCAISAFHFKYKTLETS